MSTFQYANIIFSFSIKFEDSKTITQATKSNLPQS